MRDFLDSILAFIGSESLTDAEFSSTLIQALSTSEYSQDVYAALLSVIDLRESVSGARERLRFFFLAKGTQLSDVIVKTSNIFVGSEL